MHLNARVFGAGDDKIVIKGASTELIDGLVVFALAKDIVAALKVEYHKISFLRAKKDKVLMARGELEAGSNEPLLKVSEKEVQEFLACSHINNYEFTIVGAVSNRIIVKGGKVGCVDLGAGTGLV